MRNTKSVKLMLFLGALVLVLIMLSGQGLAAKAKDRDGDGFFNTEDCNDRNNAIYPGAPEICGNGVDEDCNGSDLECSAPVCTDVDGDTYFAEVDCGTIIDCEPVIADAYPGATEVCGNLIDDDCNGTTDEGCVDCEANDVDDDGYYAVSGCGTAVDCNDGDARIYPEAVEVCDGVDNQCQGNSGYGFTDEVCTTCTDDDGDTYYATSGCGSAVDCDDGNSAVKPGISEICDDLIDNNCDGSIDEGCTVVSGADWDGDGFSDESEMSGFILSLEFDLWDSTSGEWILPEEQDEAIISLKGSGDVDCSFESMCLDPMRPDLFVIWIPLSGGASKVSLAAGDDTGGEIECNIFDFPTTLADFNVWVLRDKDGWSATRRIAQDSNISIQKAVVLIEQSIIDGYATGLSQPSSIMVDGQGLSWIRTYKIQQNIRTNCTGGCAVDGFRDLNEYDENETVCHHYKKIAAHEIWHVLSALNTPGLHIESNDFIMSPAVVFSNGTYYIGDEFSASGLGDPNFQ